MKAIVNVPVCPLMLEPRPDCELADEALYGMVVEVLDETTPAYWHVRTHYRYEGYAPAACLLTDPDKVAAWKGLRPCETPWSKNFADVLAQPKYRSYSLITLPRGALLAKQGDDQEGWTQVALADGRVGYVRSSWTSTVELDGHLTPDALRCDIIATAKLYFGTPYRWGGKSPLGIDCSGLVSMAYLLNGIVIHRDAHMKDDFPIHEIPRTKMQPADLLFFPGHVALYLGEGKYLHSTGKAGSDGVCINSLNPADPDYRQDLDEKLTVVGSYF